MTSLPHPPERPQPKVVITCALEERPHVFFDCGSFEDEQRLRLMLDGCPALLQLVDEALALRARRAA
jgi:hypothetical protein